MIDVLLDALLDTALLIPYLFITFFILELIEHKLSKKTEKSIVKYKKCGPVIGGVVGAFPQCGFSAMASSLFASKVITMGTLIAIFLSTSDEMLPVMIGENVPFTTIIKIIGFKVVAGIIIGLLVDLIFRKKENGNTIKDLCDEDNCHCKNGIFISSLIHTAKTLLFIFIASLIINSLFFFIGEDKLSNLLHGKNILMYLVSALIGLIPNCAASIILTEVYVSGIIPIGVALSGLLTGSGVGILLLYKNNKNIKENLGITLIILFTGVILGFIVDLVI